MSAATKPAMPQKEFSSRRARLRTALKRSVGLVFAGEYDGHADAPYRPHRHFEYLTGVTDEPGAVLMLDPTHPVASRREQLFLRPLNPEIEQWDGLRMGIGAALRAKTGVDAVFRHEKLPMFLLEAARRSGSLACLHPLANHAQPISPDLAVFKELVLRVPGLAIEDRTDELARMRSVKSTAELSMLNRALEITALGFDAVLRSLRPGMNEFDVQETLEHTYRTNGSRSLSFPPIAGGGVNSTVLHYRANDQPLQDGDVICIDSGTRWGGYAADITRTLPVNGTFSPRQREVYEVVLKAQLAAIKAVKPGARISQIDKAARDVIRHAGFGDSFIHGIGHHLGLDTHDITPLGDLPLREGCVITIEPGVYIPEEKLGIRIEDDVVVTRRGCTVLGPAIPKTIKEIERAMARTRRTALPVKSPKADRRGMR